MAYFRVPALGWLSEWHLLFTAAIAFLIYYLDLLPSLDSFQVPVALLLGFVLSFPFFTFLKKTFSRTVLAFDMGGVFMTGQSKFERLKPVPETVAFIKKLRSNYNTALLSNQPPDMYDNMRRKYNFDGMFDYQVIPMHAWAEKPDPKIFHAFLKTTGRRAPDVIFIDDDETNVMAARKVGMNGIVFKSLPQLKEALQAHGISA